MASQKITKTCEACSAQFTRLQHRDTYRPQRYCSRACAMRHYRGTTEERFQKYVDYSNPNGCWLWTGAVRQSGYGQFAVAHRKSVMPHRFAYEAAHGPIPLGMVVMHSCDTPLCVNTAHLSLGTPADNKTDCVKKRRHTHGVTHWKAKLTEHDVRTIRAASASYSDLATRFGVDKSTIGFIRSGRTWRHLA